MTSGPAQERSSGRSAAEEEAREAELDFDAAMTQEVDVERERTVGHLGFSRMRTEWRRDERAMMDRVKAAVDTVLIEHFSDTYAVMNDLYDVVREPVVDGEGVIQIDRHGFTVYARNPVTGAYLEDWSRLGIRQREDFLYRITAALFGWRQRAEDMRGEALFAKAVWVESFARAYDRPVSGTIEDRNAVANRESAEDRYFALYLTLLSRKADALASSMELIGQRLKDGLQ